MKTALRSDAAERLFTSHQLDLIEEAAGVTREQLVYVIQLVLRVQQSRRRKARRRGTP